MTGFTKTCVAISFSILIPGGLAQTTTAIRDGAFHVDVRQMIDSSAIVLKRANEGAGEAMPLSNGRLGAAVWSAEGLTVQLNRADTLPGRLSAGQIVVPGLRTLTHAADYAGRLNLYDGEFAESGNGMSATTYIESGSDTLVIEVKGAQPNRPQIAELRLWNPRTPHAEVVDNIGFFRRVDRQSESWSIGKTIWFFGCDPGGRPRGGDEYSKSSCHSCIV